MKTLALILAALLALLHPQAAGACVLAVLGVLAALIHPWALLACELAAIGVLCLLIRRAARAYPLSYSLPWRTP